MPPPQGTDHTPLREALAQLRLRLLDLTGRNRLLNYRHPIGKSLQFVQGQPAAIYERLTGERPQPLTIKGLPEPSRADMIIKLGKPTRPEPRDWAIQNGIPTDYDVTPGGPTDDVELRCLMYTDDLARHCRKIEREANLAIEETGANMLHLVLGFLEFPDQKDSDRLFLAPLVSVPVQLSKRDGAGRQVFSLHYNGDDIEENLSLREKLRQDHSIVLPDFDDEALNIDEYLSAIQSVVSPHANFTVRQRASLCLLSFTNMLLLRDLDPDKWPADMYRHSLLDHDLVRQVLGGADATGSASTATATEHEVEKEPADSIPLVFDADSSQHSAIVDVLHQKRNLVIIGPPGTGKSQTITNLIAASIRSGKTVLFVSEKLAALQVVKGRLERANLGSLVLELHSTKTSKKAVLETIQERLNSKPDGAHSLPGKVEELGRHRKELKEYADLLNSVTANQFGFTVHQLMWRAERHRSELSSPESVYSLTAVPDAQEVTGPELARRLHALEQVRSQFVEIGSYDSDHPFYGFEPRPLAPGDETTLQAVLQQVLTCSEQLEGHATRLAALLGIDVAVAQEMIADIQSALSDFVQSSDEHLPLELTPRFVGKEGSCQAARLACERLQVLITKYKELESSAMLVLIDEDQVSNDGLENLNALQDLGITIGHDWKDATHIRQVLSIAQTGADRLRSSLGMFTSECTRLGLPRPSSVADLRRLSDAISTLLQAPSGDWSVYSPRLAEAGTVTALRKLIAIQTEWKEVESRLSGVVYLDALPEEPILRAAISTLRQGDAWYRFLQPSWHGAKRLHRQLQTKKVKRSTSECLSELEQITRLLSIEARWDTNPSLRHYLGAALLIQEPDLAPHLRVAEWCSTMSAAMEEIGAPFLDLGCLSFSDLKKWNREVKELHAQLLAALEVCVSLNAEFPKGLESISDVEGVVASVSEIVQRVESLSRPLFDGCAVGATLEVAIAAHQAALERRRLQGLAESDGEARHVAGSYFQGIHSEIGVILAVLAVAERAGELRVPIAIRRQLIAGNPIRAAKDLIPELDGIASALAALSEHTQSLSEYGRFNLEKWAGVQTGAGLQEFANKVVGRARNAHVHCSEVSSWAAYLSRRQEAAELGLGSFVERMEDWSIPALELPSAYQYSLFVSIIRQLFLQCPLLGKFSGTKHASIREAYQRLDREIIALRGHEVARSSIASARPPMGKTGARVDEKTEMYLLQYLLPQQRPRMRVRKMLARAGRAIQAIKPCFMMGPQAVAQYLQPGALAFDLIIMDEASQLKPEEAIGAIARGTQLVVVGDQNQLPPTSFFTKMSTASEDEEQYATTDAESILDVCLAQFGAPRMLRWHYRSQHHSLIDFSNRLFYHGGMVIFPSPYGHSTRLGIRATYLPDAVYEDQTNLREAERVVDAAVEHIRSRSDESLGIATLNLKQRDLIAELLDERLASIEAAEEYRLRWKNAGQELFIRNLENVQGDERDAIIVSTTFGKPPGASVVRQNFGPISKQGGWRRLNVLFTRARRSLALFTSMKPEDIVLDGGTPEGTKALRAYLEYARSGKLHVVEETGREPDSDFERCVIDVLKASGYAVTPQLGVAGYRIDIAVEHPDHRGTYLAAIECDGATYHSAQSVRDRDRIRQEILESMGWRGRIWRIWSTDWFLSPRNQSAKLLDFLGALRETWRPDYVAGQSWIEEARRGLSEESARVRETLIEEEEERAVTVGDTVKYVDLAKPDSVLSAKITENITDSAAGLYHRGTPFARTMISAAVGAEVTLQLPGASSRTFRILEIQGPERS